MNINGKGIKVKKLMEKIEELRQIIASKVSAFWFQFTGSLLLIAFYITLAACKKATSPDLAALWVWLLIGIPVGLIELTVKWVHSTTITKWVRKLANKTVDTIVMLSLIGVTWWLAGPLAAGYFLCGFLDNHLGERQE